MLESKYFGILYLLHFSDIWPALEPSILVCWTICSLSVLLLTRDIGMYDLRPKRIGVGTLDSALTVCTVCFDYGSVIGIPCFTYSVHIPY